MELSIPPGIFDSTVELMSTILSKLVESFDELLECGGLDRMEL